MGAPNAFAAPTQSIQDGLIVGKPPRWFLDGLAAVCIGLPVGTLVTNGKLSSILLRKQFRQNVPKIPMLDHSVGSQSGSICAFCGDACRP